MKCYLNNSTKQEKISNKSVSNNLYAIKRVKLQESVYSIAKPYSKVFRTITIPYGTIHLPKLSVRDFTQDFFGRKILDWSKVRLLMIVISNWWRRIFVFNLHENESCTLERQCPILVFFNENAKLRAYLGQTSANRRKKSSKAVIKNDLFSQIWTLSIFVSGNGWNRKSITIIFHRLKPGTFAGEDNSWCVQLS